MSDKIKVEKLDDKELENYSGLTEIKDSKILGHLSAAVTPLMNTGFALRKIINEHKPSLCMIHIPNTIKPTQQIEMMTVKDKPGRFRSLFIDKKTKRIAGHGELEALKPDDMANAVAGVMNLASLVVGQYNMTQINNKLEEITDSLANIENFQENEYKSKVQALTAQIEKMTKYQSDIIADNDRRKAEIIKLDDLEHKCIELLGQANLSIESLAEKKYEYYEDYRDNLYQADKWYGYQKALFEILYKIEELRYTFYMGAESMESCFEIMSTYVKQIKAVQKKVKAWHTEAVKKLEIDMEKNRRKRDGWDAAFHWVPSLFDDESNYANMKKKTVKMIQEQQKGYDLEQTPIIDAYSDGVRIIVKDDKYYYLPEAQNIVE